jgi:hypothetical protein
MFLPSFSKGAFRAGILDGIAGRKFRRDKTTSYQPLVIALTSGKRRTSAMKFASKGEVLSFLHTSASVRGNVQVHYR